MLIDVTAVYANLPLPTTKSIQLLLSGANMVGIINTIRKYHRGEIKSPFIKITLKDRDLPELHRQGIQTEGLTHFVYVINIDGI